MYVVKNMYIVHIINLIYRILACLYCNFAAHQILYCDS